MSHTCIKMVGKKRCAYCTRIKAEYTLGSDKFFNKDFGTILTRIVGIETPLTPETLAQIVVCNDCAAYAVALEPIAVKTRALLFRLIKPKRKRKADGDATNDDFYGLSSFFGEENGSDQKNNVAKTPSKVIKRRKSMSAAMVSDKSSILLDKDFADTPVASSSFAIKILKKSAKKSAGKSEGIANGNSDSNTTHNDDDNEIEVEKSAKIAPIETPKKVTQRRKSVAVTNKNKANQKEGKEVPSKKIDSAKKPTAPQLNSPAKSLGNNSATPQQQTVAAVSSPAKCTLNAAASPIKQQTFKKFEENEDDIIAPTVQSPKKKQRTESVQYTTQNNLEEDSDELEAIKGIKVFPIETSTDVMQRSNSLAGANKKKANHEEAKETSLKTNGSAKKSAAKNLSANSKTSQPQSIPAVSSPAKNALNAVVSPKKRPLFKKFNDDDDEMSPPVQAPAKKQRAESGNYSQNDSQDDSDAVKHICSICGKIYYHQDRFAAHVASRKCAQAAYDCQHCGRKFLKAQKLNEHIRRKHADDISGDNDNDD